MERLILPQAIGGKQIESSESCRNLERGREGYLERGRLLVETEATFQDRDWGINTTALPLFLPPASFLLPLPNWSDPAEVMRFKGLSLPETAQDGTG